MTGALATAGILLALSLGCWLLWPRKPVRQYSTEEIRQLADEFAETIDLAYRVYEERRRAGFPGAQPAFRTHNGVDEDPTEFVVREPAIYTAKDLTVPVNVRRDVEEPWGWAK